MSKAMVLAIRAPHPVLAFKDSFGLCYSRVELRLSQGSLPWSWSLEKSLPCLFLPGWCKLDNTGSKQRKVTLETLDQKNIMGRMCRHMKKEVWLTNGRSQVAEEDWKHFPICASYNKERNLCCRWWTSLPSSWAWKPCYGKGKLGLFLFMFKSISQGSGYAPTVTLTTNGLFLYCPFQETATMPLPSGGCYGHLVITPLLWPPCYHVICFRSLLWPTCYAYLQLL